MFAKKSGGMTGFLIVAFFVIALFALPASATDNSGMLNVIKKDFGGRGTFSIESVKTSGDWALLTFINGIEGKRWHYNALLKKANKGWKMAGLAGMGATTDFMRICKVPENHWVALLGNPLISKNKPVLDYLKSKNSGGFYTSIRISGDWALSTWEDKESGGQTLLKKTAGKWKTVTGGGGAMDAGLLKSYGVPPNLTSKLLGVD